MKHSKNENREVVCCEHCGVENGQAHKSDCPYTICQFCKQPFKNLYGDCSCIGDHCLDFLGVKPQSFDEKTGLFKIIGKVANSESIPFVCLQCGEQGSYGVYYIATKGTDAFKSHKIKDKDEFQRRLRKNVLCEKCHLSRQS